VPSDDLSSIPDLQDRHRRVLARELKVTTFRALVHADRRDIHRKMRNLRPRPTLEQIARWQDHARSRLNEATTDRSDWHPAASFAVVFAQRQADDGWQHRIEVERTEVEPEQERRIWPSWDCGGICGWMREQVPGADRPEPGVARPAEPGATRPAEPEAAQPAQTVATPAPAGVDRERPELRIDAVTVVGPAAIAEGMAAGVAVTPSPGGPAEPPRIEISVSGARSDQEIHAAARVRGQSESGWNLQDPVVIRGGTGVASFDMSSLPVGRYDLVLAAWTPDGTVEPTWAELPDLTIPPR
jgi:hypothetical protein